MIPCVLDGSVNFNITISRRPVLPDHPFPCDHSHKKKHSLEIWAVKLRFLLIYENMLKSIATARSECTAKHENKANHNTDYIVSDLIDFYGDDQKEIKR